MSYQNKEGENEMDNRDFYSEIKGSLNDDYPTVLHRLLNLKPYEEFTLPDEVGLTFHLGGKGALYKRSEGLTELVYGENDVNFLLAINNRGRINRDKPKPTDKQLRIMELVHMLYGAKYLAKDRSGTWFYSQKPTKAGYGGFTEWICGNPVLLTRKIDDGLASLVGLGDKEPLDIVQVLKENGIEVED